MTETELETKVDDMSNEELALSFKQISQTVGRERKSVRKLENTVERLREDNSDNGDALSQAKRNLERAEDRLDKVSHLEQLLEEEIEERGIDTFEYY